MVMLYRILYFSAVFALSACVEPNASPVQPVPTPTPTFTPPKSLIVYNAQSSQEPAGEWTDWPLTPGDWDYRQDERGSIALFGPSGENALVTLRCDRARRTIYLSRSGRSVGMMVIRSSSAMKEFMGTPTGGALPFIAAEIPARDTILDATIYSRGRIAINVAGQTPLAIPSWPEIGRVVEDCRF